LLNGESKEIFTNCKEQFHASGTGKLRSKKYIENNDFRSFYIELIDKKLPVRPIWLSCKGIAD
jgi:hypothetical protein